MKMFVLQVSLLFTAIAVLLPACKCDFQPIKLIKIDECEVEPNDIQKGFSLTVDYKDGQASGVLETPFDIDENVEFEITVNKMEDGQWVDEGTSYQGGLCDVFQLYMPTVAKKLTEQLKLKEFCPMPAGKYEISNFSIDKEDLHLPEVGDHVDFHYQVKVVYKKSSIPVTCRLFEIKS